MLVDTATYPPLHSYNINLWNLKQPVYFMDETYGEDYIFRLNIYGFGFSKTGVNLRVPHGQF